MNDCQPQERELHVSWDQLHRDTRALARTLNRRVPGEDGNWRMIVAITRGGMAPACIVARELNIRRVDTISVMSYDHQTQAETRILKAPSAGLTSDGEGVLVIDDLVDTGRTLEVVRSLYPRAHFATVYAKPKGKPLVDSYVTDVDQDTWIFFPWDMAPQYIAPYRGTA